MALTKAEMSEYLFDKLGLSKRDAKELVVWPMPAPAA